MVRSTALSRSASSITISGFLPPSSICVRVVKPTERWICSPARGRAGEGDRAHRRRHGDRRADLGGAAGDEIQHALRHAGGDKGLGQAIAAERRIRRRLEHDRVAGDQRRRDLARRDRHRKIPWRDHGHHAQRLALGVDDHVGIVVGKGLARERLALDGIEAQRLRRAQDFVLAQIERLALFPRQFRGEAIDVGFEIVGGAVENLRPRGDRRLLPAREGR